MRIGLAVAAYHPGNPAEFLRRAYYELGCEAQIINREEMYRAYGSGYYQFILGVDSGLPLNLEPLLKLPCRGEKKPKVAFWFIDYRHNKERIERVPNDLRVLELLGELGGHCFQSQHEDHEDCVARGFSNSSWLPLAADPTVWRPVGSVTPTFDLSFVGHVWDKERAAALKAIAASRLRFNCLADGSCWGPNAVVAVAAAKVGFNISSFFGSGLDYDVNMRFFEVLAAGKPLITNYVPGIDLLFKARPAFIRTYRSHAEVLPVIEQALADNSFLNSGAAAREWILAGQTYRHRAETILKTMSLVS